MNFDEWLHENGLSPCSPQAYWARHEVWERMTAELIVTQQALCSLKGERDDLRLRVAELCKSLTRAPAIKLPKRIDSCNQSNGQRFNDGWNFCLIEVERLNK